MNDAMTRNSFYGWKLLAAFWVILFINLAFPAYGSSVVNAYMVSDLGIDRRTLGLMVSLYMIMTGLPGPFVAMFVNRFGVRATLTLGSLILAAGAASMAAFVDSGLEAVLVFGLIVGMGVMAGGTLATQAGTAFWFVRRRALAISIILTAGGIGGFVATRALNRTIGAFGGDWRMGWWLIAGLALVSAVVAVAFVRNRPEDVGQEPDGGIARKDAAAAERRVHITRDDWSFGEVLRTPTLWLLLFCSLGMSAGFTLSMAHSVVHLQDLGNTVDAAAKTFSVLVASTLLGKVMLGVFGDRIDPRYLWAIAVGVFGIGLLLMLDATTPMTLYAFAVGIGFGFGGGVACMMTTLSNYFGPAVYASVIGITLAVQTTAGSLGSFIAGDVYERTGSYSPVIIGIAVLCFAGAVTLACLKPPARAAATPRKPSRPKDSVGDGLTAGAGN